MIRLPLAIPCRGDTLAGTLDLPDAAEARASVTGLVIVTGGNEVRSGAWNGQAQIAARLARAGHPVLRFDRRGVGDSEGENASFTASAPDIAAAITSFRAACPEVSRLAVWGNCDAAAALMLSAGAGADALILSNPWTFEAADESAVDSATPPAAATPPQALRAYYLRRLSNPVALAGLLFGKVSPMGLAHSLLAALRRAPPPTGLATRMAEGLARCAGPARILLAGRDRTAQAFSAIWNKHDPRLRICPNASHSFVETAANEWLFREILEVLQA